jgi:hypothetical protein
VRCGYFDSSIPAEYSSTFRDAFLSFACADRAGRLDLYSGFERRRLRPKRLRLIGIWNRGLFVASIPGDGMALEPTANEALGRRAAEHADLYLN